MNNVRGRLNWRQIAVLIAALLLSGCQLQLQHAGGDALITPVSSPTDHRLYEAIELDNGLKVLLIEDPESDLAAAAMAVSVGSYDESADRPGLAHFLEHMLFLGTKKFPDPNGFGAFMSKHGGLNNAYTANDHTNYFFEIQSAAFRGALSRFSQFFTAPLFAADYVDKERNAVQSEYQLQLKDDLWRIQSAQKEAFSQAHPASRGNIGSLETLSDEQGDVRDDLITFYKRHYKASRMMLVMTGPQKLAQQIAWARRFFSRINSEDSVPDKVEAPLFEPGQLPALMAVRPEKELRWLFFDFPLPPTQAHYRTKPAGYIAHFLGHEGKGSLYAWLKQRGWIESLSAYGGALWRQDGMFSVHIELTETGAERWHDIGDALFAYLRLMQQGGAFEQWRFAEESLLSGLAFRFQAQIQPIRYVRGLAATGLQHPTEDLIRAPYLLDVFNPDLVRQYLSLLNPERVLVTRVDPDAKTDSIEKWFQVAYKLSPVTDDLRKRWQNSKILEALSLPEKNVFIPEDFSLLPEAFNINETWPPVLLPTERIWAWHLPDISFSIPEAHLRFRLRSLALTSTSEPISNSALTSEGNAALTSEGSSALTSEGKDENKLTAKQQAILPLYLSLIQDHLATYVYSANLAGLAYSLGADSGEVIVGVRGYSDRQDVLLAKVMDAFVNLDIDPNRFASRKAQLIREWNNSLKNRPYVRNLAAISDALVVDAFRPEDLAEALKKVTREDVVRWRSKWLSDVGVAALMYGNLDEKRALHLAKVLADALPASRPLAEPSAARLVSLAEGGFLHAEQSDHPDAALVVYVQGQNQSMQERARFALLSQMLHNQYFDYLRTERQLGYVVAARNKTWVNTPGLVFIAQSPTVSATDILSATRTFMANYERQLKNMSYSIFEGYKTAIVARILEKDKNAAERSVWLWRELQRGASSFNSREKLARAVAALDRVDMQNFYKDFLVRFRNHSFVSYSGGKFAADLATEGLSLQFLDDFYDIKNQSDDKLFKFNSRSP